LGAAEDGVGFNGSLIIGAGIGGLTLGLMLHRAGIACAYSQAAPELKASASASISCRMPRAELCALGLEDALPKSAVTTREYCFYNRFASTSTTSRPGALPATTCRNSPFIAGIADGTARRFHRARRRDKVITGWRCTRVDYDGARRSPHFEDAYGKSLPSQRGTAVVSAEGIHSVLRKQVYPDEGPPKYSASTCGAVLPLEAVFVRRQHDRIGWHHPAKLLIYPIANNIDAQAANW